ncbi:endonuclease/exonuclease/phosphatase family protein [Xylanimonas sp. McL0601]|uniref:endonuclease/exonuclease/phosphatase family protein n=1 Tax=Xylanimonas sp. McL0601 TaxID=3414739 RepID=UPI003CEC9856
MSVRLVTFNVQHGQLPDGRVDPAFLGQAVAGLGADVVAVQEVDRAQVRSGGVDLAHVVAEAVGAREHRYLPAVAGTMEPRRATAGSVGTDDPAAALAPLVDARGRARVGAAVSVLRSPAGRSAIGAYVGTWRSRRRARGDEHDDVPGYGIALISRLPVREWRRLRLPIGSPWLFGRLQLGKDEPRVAIVAVVETPDGPLTVVATHLSSWRRWSRRQLRWLVRRLSAAPRPLVLLGDLNIRADEPAAITGWRELVHVPTYPRERPKLRLDHVLVDDGAETGGDATLVHVTGPAHALDLGISDHRAVVVDVSLRPPGPPEPRPA